MARYAAWLNAPEVLPPREIASNTAIDAACRDGDWLGLAVFVYAAEDWTVFEELSGGLTGRPAERWVALAAGGDLVYASYNDTVPYANLVVVEAGQVVRYFLADEQDPSENVDVGHLPEERKGPFADWVDVAGWIDADEPESQDRGWLWVHRAT